MKRCLNTEKENDELYKQVKVYYGDILKSSEDLKTDACCTSKRPRTIIRQILEHVPEKIKSKYYGCGTPIPEMIEGCRVLDLGSGSGRDCYVAAKLVGEKGFVTGVDMTKEQIETARSYVDQYNKEYLKYTNVNLEFVQAYIEYLGQTPSNINSANIKSNDYDLVISNCVLNLSPNKNRVLSEVYRVLKDGGEFYFSDVYCDRRLPSKLLNNQVLHGECLSGALYFGDFIQLCRETGFVEPRIVSRSPITITEPKIIELLGDAKFESITFRLFKIIKGCEDIEPYQENYGQSVVFKGSDRVEDESFVKFDEKFQFIKGKKTFIDGNTYTLLYNSRFSKYFEFKGDRKVHYGQFKHKFSNNRCCKSVNGDTTSNKDEVKSKCC